MRLFLLQPCLALHRPSVALRESHAPIDPPSSTKSEGQGKVGPPHSGYSRSLKRTCQSQGNSHSLTTILHRSGYGGAPSCSQICNIDCRFEDGWLRASECLPYRHIDLRSANARRHTHERSRANGVARSMQRSMPRPWQRLSNRRPRHDAGYCRAPNERSVTIDTASIAAIASRGQPYGRQALWLPGLRHHPCVPRAVTRQSASLAARFRPRPAPAMAGARAARRRGPAARTG